MGKISEALTYGLTIRESANDGSDFTNPAADYRRLFLGEDGQLHVKDSAGAVTDIGAASGSMATDALWDAAGDLAVGTGANTGGRLAAGAAGGVLAMGNSAVIWNAGTSFPASKATGDRYWRTDLGMEFYWDGTRWVTTTLYHTQISGPFDGDTTAAYNGQPLAVTGKVIGRMALWHSDFQLYFVNMYGFNYTSPTNDGSKYWTFTLTGSITTTAYGNYTTAADTAGVNTSHVVALNVAAGATERSVYVIGAKTSTPSSTYVSVAITYRLIGT